MSTQRGNASRTRAQKHRNETVYKNDLYDTSKRTQFLNSLEIAETCQRCTDVIEWKVKYKKYKQLKAPTKCIKCEQKTVKRAYHTICQDCAAKLGICTKCGMSKEIVVKSKPTAQEQAKMKSQVEQLIKHLPVRKRRTIFRYLAKNKKDGNTKENSNIGTIQELGPISVEELEEIEKLVKNIAKLKTDDDDLDDFTDDFDEFSIDDSD